MRSADRGISTVDGDGAVHVGRRSVVAVLQQVLDVLYYEINRHYKPHDTHCLILSHTQIHIIMTAAAAAV